LTPIDHNDGEVVGKFCNYFAPVIGNLHVTARVCTKPAWRVEVNMSGTIAKRRSVSNLIAFVRRGQHNKGQNLKRASSHTGSVSYSKPLRESCCVIAEDDVIARHRLRSGISTN
jgi:hypothetical protein